MIAKIILALLTAHILSGCVSIADINERYYLIGKAWQLDNQRTEGEYRHRVIEAPYIETFHSIKKTFLALGMPVEESSISKGILYAENIAPFPLTHDEWLEVKRIETPRLKEIGGSLFKFEDNPKTFTITVRATLSPMGDRTLVTLDYVMDSKKLRSYGITPTPHAPRMMV